MKNISKILAITFVALVFGFSAKAQDPTTATTSASASAVIVTPISILSDVDLVFGTIVPDLDGGTVTLDPTTDNRSFGSGITGISSTVSSAQFTVNGTPDQAYTITLPTGVVSLTGPALSTPMTLNAWTTDIPGLSGTLTGGTQTFKVGATLNVGGGQMSGSYTGSFDVTVDYD